MIRNRECVFPFMLIIRIGFECSHGSADRSGSAGGSGSGRLPARGLTGLRLPKIEALLVVCLVVAKEFCNWESDHPSAAGNVDARPFLEFVVVLPNLPVV